MVAGDYPPIPATPLLPTVNLGDLASVSFPLDPVTNLSFTPSAYITNPPVSSGESLLSDLEDSPEPSPSQSTSQQAPAAAQVPSGDPFKTAIENFALAKTFAGMSDSDAITEEMYEQLVSELFGVFTRLEAVGGPEGWNVY